MSDGRAWCMRSSPRIEAQIGVGWWRAVFLWPLGFAGDVNRGVGYALCAAALLVSFFIGPTVFAAEGLPPPVVEVLKKEKLSQSSLSLLVQPVGGKPLVRYRAATPRNPASTMKIVTTWAGLNLLGPAYRWKTPVLKDVKAELDKKGVLHGNLYLRGAGDPFLIVERLWTLFREVRRQGVKTIRGDIVLDDRFFALRPHRAGAFDGKPQRAYNVGPSAILLNFQATEIRFAAAKDGQKFAQVHIEPPLAGARVINELRDSKEKCWKRKLNVDVYDPNLMHIHVHGSFPKSCSPHSFLRVIGTREAYARGLLTKLWADVGGSLKGTVRFGEAPRGKAGTVIASHISPPLSRLTWSMNKFSNNVMTRQLLLTVGARVGGAPGNLTKGRNAITNWLKERGIPLKGFRIDNGAGLSRSARISADTMAAIIRDVYASPLRAELLSTLPLSGIDGSLRRRYKNEPLAGMAHMKTGLLDGVRAIAGIVRSAAGTDYVVVALQNHKDVHIHSGTRVQDVILRWVYDLPRP